VFSFRVSSWVDLNSWVASIKHLIDSDSSNGVVGKYSDEISSETAFEVRSLEDKNEPWSDTPPPVGEFDDFGETHSQEKIHNDDQPRPPDTPPPMALSELIEGDRLKYVGVSLPRVRRSAGILMLSENGGKEWREIYGVVFDGLLMEFDHIHDKVPRSMWKLTPEIRIHPGNRASSCYLLMLVYGAMGMREIAVRGYRTATFDTTLEWGVSLSELVDMDYSCVSVDGKLSRHVSAKGAPALSDMAREAAAYSLKALLPLSPSVGRSGAEHIRKRGLIQESSVLATALSYYAGGKGSFSCHEGGENTVKIYSALLLSSKQIPPWIQSEHEFDVQLWQRRGKENIRDILVDHAKVLRVRNSNGKRSKSGRLLVYTACYKAPDATIGKCRLHVKFRGQHIFGSPYTIKCVQK